MEALTTKVVSTTGLEPRIAKAAIGHVLLFLRDEVPEGHIAEFIDKSPLAHEAVQAAAAMGDGGVTAAIERLTSFMGHGRADTNVLAGKLENLGLTEAQVNRLVNEIVSRAEILIGAAGAAKIRQILPDLAERTGHINERPETLANSPAREQNEDDAETRSSTESPITATALAVDPTSQKTSSLATTHAKRLLISSEYLEGATIHDASGKEIGRIDRLVIDRVAGQVRYAVVDFCGFMCMRHENHLVPWGSLTYDNDRDWYTSNVTEKQLETAPEFTDDSWMTNRDWETQLHQHYGARPYWDIGPAADQAGGFNPAP